MNTQNLEDRPSLPPPLLLLLLPLPFPRAALLTRDKPPAPALSRVRAMQHVQKRKGEAVIDRHVAMVPVVVPRVVDSWDGNADAGVVQDTRESQKGHVDEEGDRTHGQERRGAVEDAVVPEGLERVDVHVVEGLGRLFGVGVLWGGGGLMEAQRASYDSHTNKLD